MPLNFTLAQLETAQLVRHLAEEEPAYIFKHALTQDAAYQSLLQKQRREIHRYVAQSYEAQYGDQCLDDYAGILAKHYAEAGDDAKTMAYSIKAAEAAARLFDFPEASLHYASALDAFKRLPDSEEYRPVRVDTIIRYVEFSWGATVKEELFALLAEAETLARTLRNPDGTLGDPLRLARAQLMLGGLYAARGEFHLGMPHFLEGLEQAKTLGDTALLATPLTQVGLGLTLQGHFVDAEPYLVQAIDLVNETPNRWEWFYSVGALGISLAMRGQVAVGLAEIHRTIERMQANQNAFGITGSSAMLLAAILALGDMSQLFEASQRAVEEASKSRHILFVYIGLGFQALALSRLGKHSEAHTTMADARAVSAKLGGQLMMSDWLAAANAEIAYNAGDFENALRLAEQAVKDAQATSSIFEEGWAERVSGQALAALQPPRYDEAEIHFGESLRRFAEGDAKIELARTHLAWGKILRERGDANSARTHFEQAAAQFEASGLTHELERVRAMMGH
jgi:tetratricopeptide (TPR) repeat protein